MLGSLSVMLLAAAAGATPCESLRTVSLSQATIVTADVVRCRSVRSAAASDPACDSWPAGRSSRRASGRCAASAAATHSSTLPRDDGAQAFVGLEHQRRTLDADRELERQADDDGQRRVRRIHPGLRRHAGRPCASATPRRRPIPATRLRSTVPTACSHSVIRRRSSTLPTAPSTRRP